MSVTEQIQADDEGLERPVALVDAGEEAKPQLSPKVAAFCPEIAGAEPCGADLDLDGDSGYLNFFAEVEGVFPATFFSPEDGKPFDSTTVDFARHLAIVDQLLARTRDIRLLTSRARMFILNKDLGNFALSVAAIAELLEQFWDEVHPRPGARGLTMRRAAMSELNQPTVLFPLQYAPLFEGRRVGSVTYRSWMIATGEAKPREGEAMPTSAALSEALAEANPAACIEHLTLLYDAVVRIDRIFAAHDEFGILDPLKSLSFRMLSFVSPQVAEQTEALAQGADREADDPAQFGGGQAAHPAGPAPTSIAQAAAALSSIADYYSRSEPSSPTLPLVLQAHQLIGKSFFEVMSILMPGHVDKASFQIGGDHVFDLPVSKLPSPSQHVVAPQSILDVVPGEIDSEDAAPPTPRYVVQSRSQALALLELVQRYFRHTQPSSPIPMLCERARALAERDFMSVLGDVLPKSALKAFNADR